MGANHNLLSYSLTPGDARHRSQTNGLQDGTAASATDLGTSVSALAVEVACIFVCLPIFCNTSRFWTTSSRVGQIQSA